MLKLILFVTFFCSVFSLQVCREKIAGKHMGHDWIMFDAPYLFVDSTKIIEAAKKHESKIFFAGEAPEYRASQDVYVMVSFDGTTSEASIKGKVTKDGKVEYKVVKDLLHKKYETAFSYLIKNDTEVVLAKRPKIKGSLRSKSLDAPASPKLQLPSPDDYLTNFPPEKVWSHSMYPKCIHFASQNTAGYHQVSTDSDQVKGLKDDDDLTLRMGCKDAIDIPIPDQHSRVAALLVCLEFMRKDVVYDNEPRNQIERASSKKSTHWYSLDHCEHPDGRGQASYNLIKAAIPPRALCWDFVQAVRNVLCLLKKSSSDVSFVDEDISYYFGTDSASFIRRAKPIPFIVTPEEIEDPKVCRVHSLTNFVFRSEDNYLSHFTVGRDPEDLQEALVDEPKKKAIVDQLESAQSVSAENVIEKISIKTVTDPTEQLQIIAYPAADIQKITDPDDSKDKLGIIIDKGKKYAEKYKKFPLAMEVKQGLEIIEEFPEIKKKKFSLGSSSKSSEPSTTALSFASYLSTQKSLKYSEENSRAAASFLDVKMKEHFNANNFGEPLRIIARTFGAMQLSIETSLFHTARTHGVCLSTMSREECICNVVTPIVNSLSDFFTLEDPLDGENRAVTFLAQISADYSVSVLTGSYCAGLYVTYEWMRDGSKTWRLEVGAVLSRQGAFALLSTGILSAGSSVSAQLGIFFGRNDQISGYAKNIGVGVDIPFVLDISFGLTLMFREGYQTKLNTEECAVSKSALERYFAWPVSPRCIRGFAISVSFGATAGVEMGLTLSVTTSFSKNIAKKVAVKTSGEAWKILPPKRPRLGGSVVAVGGGVLEEIESELEEISKTSSLLF